MSTTNIQSEQLSLNGLFKKYHIVRIPIIQRDYAQGRIQETQVRKSFLDQLKSVLSDTSAHLDLDFVYGDELSNDGHEGKCFIPLDGQQRLTTLFLLHYYLSRRDAASRSDFRNRFGEQKQDTQRVESRFRYETRFSSTAFLNALFQREFRLDDLVTVGTRLGTTPITEANVFSQTMMNFGWFVDSWTHDPTVDSMLRMLDAIHVCFKDISGDLYGRLISEKDSAITFHLLPMQGNGLDEDLYIKMNARGLPLTGFEKIKARIIQRLGDVTETRLLSRTQSEKEKMVPLKEYFSFMADTRWAQLFWPYHDEKKVEITIGQKKESHTIKEIDSRILNFIAAVTVNYQAVNWESDQLNQALMDKPGSMNWGSLENLDDDFFIRLADAFDAVMILLDASNQQLPSDFKELFKTFVTGTKSDRQYGRRIQFYAFYRFGILHKDNLDPDELFDCCRVVRNLVQNTRFDSEEDFCKAIRSIDSLLNQSRSIGILNYLAENKDLPEAGLDRRQLKEERMKAQLLLLPEWKDEILNAEENLYLEGQIISILSLSGIESQYDEKGNTLGNITEEQKAKFKRFTGLFSEIFNEGGDWRMRWRRIRSSDGHFWLVAITACMAKRGESNPIRALSGNGVGNTIFRRHRRKVLLRCGNSWIVHSRISRSICKALLSLGLSMICMTVGVCWLSIRKYGRTPVGMMVIPTCLSGLRTKISICFKRGTCTDRIMNCGRCTNITRFFKNR